MDEARDASDLERHAEIKEKIRVARDDLLEMAVSSGQLQGEEVRDLWIALLVANAALKDHADDEPREGYSYGERIDLPHRAVAHWAHRLTEVLESDYQVADKDGQILREVRDDIRREFEYAASGAQMVALRAPLIAAYGAHGIIREMATWAKDTQNMRTPPPVPFDPERLYEVAAALQEQEKNR